MDELHQSGQSPSSHPGTPPATAAPPPETRDDETLNREISRLKQRLKDMENRQLPEQERFRRELAEVTAERDNAAGELRQLKRRNAVAELARQHRFNDPDYLDYLLERRGIAPDDPRNTEDFLRKFRGEQPRFFDVELKSGAGSRPGVGSNTPLVSETGASGIAAMLADAPEIN